GGLLPSGRIVLRELLAIPRANRATGGGAGGARQRSGLTHGLAGDDDAVGYFVGAALQWPPPSCLQKIFLSRPPTAHTLVALESLPGPLRAALLGLIIRRKLMRWAAAFRYTHAFTSSSGKAEAMKRKKLTARRKSELCVLCGKCCMAMTFYGGEVDDKTRDEIHWMELHGF